AAGPDGGRGPGQGRARFDGPYPEKGMDDVQPPPDLSWTAGMFRPQTQLRGLRPGETLSQDRRGSFEQFTPDRNKTMNTLLERFCRYVRIDTMADEAADAYPSSPGQLELGRLLVRELQELGIKDAAADEYGIVLATLPATVNRPAPTIAFIAHLDTSPETSGHGV